MANLLTEKIGPLPGWAWGASGVAVVVGVKWYMNRAAANTAAATPIPENSGDTGYTDDTYANDGTTGDYGSANTSQTSNTPTTPWGSTITSNLQWSYLATEELVAAGDSPTGVSSALYKYLNGLALTTEEQGYINSAIQLLGAPPENVGTPIVVTTPPPVKTPPTKPVSKIPKGPYAYEKTTATIRTVPEIANHYHLSSATVLLYNPQFIKDGYDIHALPVGINYRIPSTKAK